MSLDPTVAERMLGTLDRIDAGLAALSAEMRERMNKAERRIEGVEVAAGDAAGRLDALERRVGRLARRVVWLALAVAALAGCLAAVLF